MSKERKITTHVEHSRGRARFSVFIEDMGYLGGKNGCLSLFSSRDLAREAAKTYLAELAREKGEE